MKRFVPMLTRVVGVLVALALLSAPLTVWAQEGHGAEGARAAEPAGANLGALITLLGVLAILAVGSVYMAWSEPEPESDE